MGGSAVFCIGSLDEYVEIRSLLSNLASYGHNIYVIVPNDVPRDQFADNVTVLAAYAEQTHQFIKSNFFNALIVCYDSLFVRSVVKNTNASAKILYQGRRTSKATPLDLGEIITHVYVYDEDHLRAWRLRYPERCTEGPWIKTLAEDDSALWFHLHCLLTNNQQCFC